MPDYFYDVAIIAGGVGLDIRVNDGPLWHSGDAATRNFEIIANRWLRPGRNELSIRLNPVEGQKALGPALRFSLQVLERERGAPREVRREIHRVEYTATTMTRDFRPSGEAGAITDFAFDCKVDFPEWAWVRGQTIPNSPEMFASLLREIDRIHELLRRRDIGGLLETVRQRDREIATAHFEMPDQQWRETQRDFEAFTNNPKMPLEPRETDNLSLKIYGNGKLARIEDENGDPPIYFLSQDETLTRFVPFLFCLVNQRWLVVR